MRRATSNGACALGKTRGTTRLTGDDIREKSQSPQCHASVRHTITHSRQPKVKKSYKKFCILENLVFCLQGHYACLAVKKGTTGDGSLVSPVLERTESSKRLTFWYHLYGPSAPCLRVFVTCARLTHRLWQLCGNQNPSWKIARATIPPLCVRYQLTFTSSGNGSRFGDVCLDDVAFDGSSVSGE